MNGQKVSGQRQPTVWVPSGASSKSPVSIPVSDETTSTADLSPKNAQEENSPKSPPSTPSEQDLQSQENSSSRFVSVNFWGPHASSTLSLQPNKLVPI